MRALNLIALACLISACATPPPTALETRSASPARIVGFATLAPVESFEWRAAPTFTALAQLRHNAARELTAGRIDLATAKSIQARADMARTLLDNALTADREGRKEDADSHLIGATRLVAQAHQTLKGQP
jgi:hypothetical protein